MRTPRTMTVVGSLCRSDAEARKTRLDLRADPLTSRYDWGLVRIKFPRRDTPVEIGKIHLPPSTAFLKTLCRLLSGREVRRTAKGREALQLVRTALKRRTK